MQEAVIIKDVFAISERGSDKARWTKVGVGFVNKDNSINIVLDALPFNGRLHIRDRAGKARESK